MPIIINTDFSGGSDGKESASKAGDLGSIPELGTWQPTPVFLPGKSHGQRNLVGYSPRSHKELDKTERLAVSLSHILLYYFPGGSVRNAPAMQET